MISTNKKNNNNEFVANLTTLEVSIENNTGIFIGKIGTGS